MKQNTSSIAKVNQKLDDLARIEDQKEQRAIKHRRINTGLMIIVAIIAIFAYLKVDSYLENEQYNTEIAQIMNDESLRLERYNDSLGNATIGFGHLITENENYQRITPHEAIALLHRDYAIARDSVERNYPWADDDVKLVLINMTYQMGPSRLAKFEKSLMAMKLEDYDLAAAELLNSVWANQARNRAVRIAGRILQLDNSFW